MKRPNDPRNGQSPPKPIHSKTSRLTIADFDYNLQHKVPLEAVIRAWNKAVKDHESQGHRIIEGPHFESSTFYGSSLALTYTYEWDNLNYSAEQAEWAARIAKYEQDLAAWKQVEEDRKKGLAKIPNDIDAQIQRAEHRLANLKAVKDKQPIPFPEG